MMANGGAFPLSLIDGVSVIRAPSYFTEETGQLLLQMVIRLAGEGNLRFVLDFQDCKVINSPGIGSVMDLALRILDDFKGRMILTNLDPVKVQVFTLVGILPLVPVASSLDDAVREAGKT